MKKLFTTILLALVVFSSQAEIHTVLVGQDGLTFSPSSLSVHVGDTIRFSLVSGFHTTTSTSVPSGAETWNVTMSGSGTTEFDYLIEKEGDYVYQCNPHVGAGMKGSFSASIVSGMNDKFSTIKNSLIINPNPAADQTSLKFNSANSFKGSIKIFDANGIMVWENKIKVESGENFFPINTSAFKSGLYYVNLLNKEDSFLVKKLVKQ